MSNKKLSEIPAAAAFNSGSAVVGVQGGAADNLYSAGQIAAFLGIGLLQGGSDLQILVGATTMTVTHGLTFLPSRVTIWANDTATATILKTSGWAVDKSLITPTQFVISFPSAVTGSVNISFQAFAP